MSKKKWRQLISALPFIGPAFLINIFIILGPSLIALVLAFYNWDGLGLPTFAGLENFIVVFTQPIFVKALSHNLIWTLIFLTVPVGLALIVAEIFRKAGWDFLEPIFFVPYTLPVVIIGIIWQFIYNPVRGIGSFINMGLLGNRSLALYAIAFANIWAWWGFLAAVFHGAVQGIPENLYEAAVIDGANDWDEFIHITIPQIAPTLAFMEIMTIIWSFKVFDWVWVTTQGGPAGSTELLATLLYKKAFYQYKIGEASVVGIVIAVFGMMAVGFLYYLRRRGYDV